MTTMNTVLTVLALILSGINAALLVINVKEREDE